MHRVLEVEDAGVRRRPPSGCAACSRGAPRPRGCASALCTSRSQTPLPAAPAARRPRLTPYSRATHQSGNSCSSRRSSASSYGGSALASARGLPVHQRADRVAHQRVGLRRRLGVGAARRGTACGRGRSAAGSLRRRRGQHAAARAARRPAISCATWTNGRTSSCGGGASITMKLSRRRRRRCASSGGSSRRPTPARSVPAAGRAARPAARSQRSKALVARRVGPGDAVRRRDRCTAVMDNRFYKPPAVHRRLVAIARALALRQPPSPLPCRRCAARPAPQRSLGRAGACARAGAASPAAPARRAASAPARMRRRRLPRAAGDDAQLPLHAARPTRLRGRPDLRPSPRAMSSCAAAASCSRADRLELRQRRRPARARAATCASRRDGNFFAGPELQLHVQRFEGFFTSPSTSSRAPAPAASAERIDFIDDAARAAHARHLHQLPAQSARRRRHAGLAAEHRARQARLRGQRRHRRRRGAALPGRADPGRAGAELSAHRRAQVGLAAADASTSTARAASSSRCRTTGTSRRNRDATFTPTV